MSLWSSHPWSAGLASASGDGPTEVTRAVLELIHEIASKRVDLQRAALEVIAPVGYTAPVITSEVTRAIVEAIGLAALYAGRRGEVARVSVEVLGSALQVYKGLDVPNVVFNGATIAYAATLDYSKAGTLGLTDGAGGGYRLEWASTSPTFVTEVWETPLGAVRTTFPAPSGRFVRILQRLPGLSQVVTTSLGGVRGPSVDGSGVIHELIGWAERISDADTQQVRDYLTCKWVPDECGVANFYEDFNDISVLTDRYTLTRLDGTPVTIFDPDFNTLTLSPGEDEAGGNNNRLQASLLNVGSLMYASRSMPAQEYREFSVEFQINGISPSATEQNHVIVRTASANAIMISPRDNVMSNRAFVDLNGSRTWMGSAALAMDSLYQFRIIRGSGSTGNWTLTRLNGGGLTSPQVVATGSGTLDWDWRQLRFDADNAPGTSLGNVVVYDNIAALGVLPTPP